MIVLGFSGFSCDSHQSGGSRSLFAKTNLTFDNIFAFRDGEVPFSMFPLGFLGHDASAAIIEDGRVIACAAEERFTRVKHSLNLAGNTLLPRNAISYCLNAKNISMKDVDVVAHYCDFRPSVINERLKLLIPFLSVEDAVKVKKSYEQVYKSMLDQKVVSEQIMKITGRRPNKFFPVKHHEAHAASAFFPSGFKKALILTLDGTGELESSLLAIGNGSSIQEIHRAFLPISLGSLYLIITVFLGFRSLGDEYKVMGLAGYGNPNRFRKVFKALVVLRKNGRYSTPLLAKEGFREWLIQQLGRPRRRDEPIKQIHADIAAALQESVTEAVLHTLRYARNQTGISRLCMAGGVALNCLLNGEIARSRLFKEIFVQPASSDEGCSVGAALYANFSLNKQIQRSNAAWTHAYLGPDYSLDEIIPTLNKYQDKLTWKRYENITEITAKELAKGKVIAWFQGRMEFGPRALGNRSILADPRDPGMKDRINAKIKHREKFRPFAPAVQEEEAAVYFNLFDLKTSPFMLYALPVLIDQQKKLPAITHIDGTARVQTVSRVTNPLFWDLIEAFKKITGVPVILNTSFNVNKEPIVCNPDDAINCFLSTDLDILVLGDFIINKQINSEP
jgi:carbamoyltransferase